MSNVCHIRSKQFGDQRPNNSLVFSYKNKITSDFPDGTPDWNVVGIPAGLYEIKDINDAFNRNIKSITGNSAEEKPKINILVDQLALSSVIEIAEGYSVDIYSSSIRTVLGWPEVPSDSNASAILTCNNSPDGDGRHLSPGNVNREWVIQRI